MDAREVTKDLEITRCEEFPQLKRGTEYKGSGLQNLSIGVGIRMEGNFTHGMGNFSILHEAVPHKTATQILCHQHADTHVDADDVIAVPPCFGLEGIGKSVAPPKLISISFAHG